MRRAFPEFAADWLLTLLVVRPKICGKSPHTLRGNLKHHRCDEKKDSGAQLSGQRTRNETANDSADRSAHGNKSEKPFRLLWCENVSHERPKHCRGEKIENADPDEKYGRKDRAFLCGWHPAHEEEEKKKVRDGETVGDRDKPPPRHARDDSGIKCVRDQHADQRAGIHPREIFNAAVCANLITDRPDDVIAAENDKVENECQQQRVDLVRLYINDFRKNAFHVNDEARVSNDEGMTKLEELFVIRIFELISSFVIRISSFLSSSTRQALPL